jgi:hypothetical protein
LINKVEFLLTNRAFNKITEKPFMVLSNKDLNPELKAPYGVSDQKVLCCGPCKSEPIFVKFDVQKSKTIIFLYHFHLKNIITKIIFN